MNECKEKIVVVSQRDLSDVKFPEGINLKIISLDEFEEKFLANVAEIKSLWIDVELLHGIIRLLPLPSVVRDMKLFYVTGKKVLLSTLFSFVEPGADRKAYASAEAEFITASESVKKMLKRADTIATTDAGVLITGETGTGKEVLARRIAAKSSRANEPFIAVNCAAIPHHLMEAELFGYKKGAFTGALYDSPGKFRAADQGTIFLDEIGEIPLLTQPKLLRVLDYGEIEPLGEHCTVQINARLIAATNLNLEESIANGLFREDLYYRINNFRIHIPPLRERVEDIPVLFNYYLQYFANIYNRMPMLENRGDIVKFLTGFHWPGNVRQLKNLCENLVIFAEQQKIDSSYIKDILGIFIPENNDKEPRYKMQVGLEFKKQIEALLEKYDYNISAVAKYLEMSRTNLYRKIKKYNISVHRRTKK